MTELAIRDISAIGAALDRVVQDRAQVRPKGNQPHIPGYFRPDAVKQFRDELAREGFEIVRVAG